MEILIRHGETPPAHPAPGDCQSVGQSVCRSVPKHKKKCVRSSPRWFIDEIKLAHRDPNEVVFLLSRSRVESHSFTLHCYVLHCSALFRFAWIGVA